MRQSDLNQPLSKAVFDRDVKQIKDLLNLGADVNATDSNGFTLLMIAAARGDVALVKLLLSYSTDANLAMPDWRIALMQAARSEHANVVKLLLVHGAEVQPELQGDAIVEVAIKSIAEDRANHRLACHGITQSLTATEDGFHVTPANSKEFNLALMSVLPAELVVKITAMSAASDMSYALASRIA